MTREKAPTTGEDGTPGMRKKSWRRTTYGALAVAVVAAAGVGVWKSGSAPGPLPEISSVTEELTVLTGDRVFFGHQSVGTNTLEGLEALAQGAVSVIETTDPSDIAPGTVAHAYVGTNGDPQSKIDAFADIIEGGVGDAVDVAVLKLCYTDVTAGSDAAAVATAYIAALDQLAARYPAVRFVGATVPLMTEPDWVDGVKGSLGRGDGRSAEDNIVRQQFNELMRAHFDGNAALFDIADVESMHGRTAHRNGDTEYYALSLEYASDPGHLNAEGAHAAATEFVRVLAATPGSR